MMKDDDDDEEGMSIYSLILTKIQNCQNRKERKKATEKIMLKSAFSGGSS